MLKLEKIWEENSETFVEVSSESRSELSDEGRKFAMQELIKKDKAARTCGMDASASIVSYHPKYPDKDPYEVLPLLSEEEKGSPVWCFRQIFKMIPSK